MCTYVTAHGDATGSGKGPQGWFPLTSLTVYFDHPVHAPADHTMNIDFANPERGAAARVAVELTAETAVTLLQAIAQVLTEVPGQLTGIDTEAARRLLDAAHDLTPTAVVAAARSRAPDWVSPRSRVRVPSDQGFSTPLHSSVMSAISRSRTAMRAHPRARTRTQLVHPQSSCRR